MLTETDLIDSSGTEDKVEILRDQFNKIEKLKMEYCESVAKYLFKINSLFDKSVFGEIERSLPEYDYNLELYGTRINLTIYKPEYGFVKAWIVKYVPSLEFVFDGPSEQLLNFSSKNGDLLEIHTFKDHDMVVDAVNKFKAAVDAWVEKAIEDNNKTMEGWNGFKG